MNSPAMEARRSVVEIAYEMLSACSHGGINRAAIAYGWMLSYDQLHRYLARLSYRGLIRAGGERHRRIVHGGREAPKPVSTAVQSVTVSND
jgi:predicted transcriptional regulator